MKRNYAVYMSGESLDGSSGFDGTWVPKLFRTLAEARRWVSSSGSGKCRSGHSKHGSDHAHHLIGEIYAGPGVPVFDELLEDKVQDWNRIELCGPFKVS